MRWLAAVLVLLCAGCGAANAKGEHEFTRPQRAVDACSAAARAADPGVVVRWPKGAGASKPPLVVAFHGAGQTGRDAQRYYDFDPLADRDGVAMAYPVAAHRRFWQLTGGQHDDVDRTRALLQALAPCVDPARTYATGVSNGGGFTARVGCELATSFAAVAPVAGGYKALPHCPSSTPPESFLEIHGAKDQVVPYDGSGPRHVGAVEPFTDRWAARNGCDAKPRRRALGHGVTERRFEGCEKAVRALKLAGTDHGFPGGNQKALGGRHFPAHDPTGLKARTVIWGFFDLS